MAIRSISRLQHRRGLKSDLPPKLHEGELGWCLDTKELFIGNSDAYGGNSQILTQFTPNDQIIQHAYQGYTGVPADSRARSIGRKLDDSVSVRDYGAIGNGIVDDHAAIQNAIEDRYAGTIANGFSPLSGRVTIWLPAGTYRITKSIKLYPHVRLQGEGADRTRIVLGPDLDICVMQTADSNGETEGNIGAESAQLPDGITLVDLSLQQIGAQGDGIWLQRCSRVRLQGVCIIGSKDSESSNTAAIRIQSLGTSFIPSDLGFTECEIQGFGHGIYCDDPISDLRMASSSIHDCVNGLTLGLDPVLGGPARTRVSATLFKDISSWGIGCFGSNQGVISQANAFDSVGSITTGPITWGVGSADCASIADQFTNCPQPNISDLTPGRNLIVGPQQVSISRQQPNFMGPIAIENGHPVVYQDTTLSWDYATYNNIRLDYKMNRDSDKRVGKLTILTDGTNAVVEDEFTTLGSDLGITFGYRFDSGSLILTYVSTNTGFDAELWYTETKWLD